MTTYTLDQDNYSPSRFLLTPIYTGTVFTSRPGAIQVEAGPGDRWGLTLTWENITAGKAAYVRGLIAKLVSKEHRLRVDFAKFNYSPQGNIDTADVVEINGTVGVGASSIDVDGIAAGSVTNWLRAGDLIDMGQHLKLVAEDVDSSSGAATIPFWPPLTEPLGDNAQLQFGLLTADFWLRNAPPFGSGPFQDDWLHESIVLEFEEDVQA